MFQHGKSGGNRLVRYGFLLGEIAIEYISDKNEVWSSLWQSQWP
jgi:hypothetical protein